MAQPLQVLSAARPTVQALGTRRFEEKIEQFEIAEEETGEIMSVYNEP